MRLEHRYFIYSGSGDILKEIHRTICRSNQIVLIISLNFLQSGITEYILHDQIVKKNYNKIILILLEGNKHQLPSILRGLTQLDASEMSSGDLLKKLRRSIRTCFQNHDSQIPQLPPSRKNSFTSYINFEMYDKTKLCHRDNSSVQKYNDVGLSEQTSVVDFHAKPAEFVFCFNALAKTGTIYPSVERLILRDILPLFQESTKCQGCINLAHLSFCQSILVKSQAMHIFEKILVNDNLNEYNVESLLETEQILRDYILSRTFGTETLELQVLRLKIYGRLLFHIALHMEEHHLLLNDEIYLDMQKIVVILEKYFQKLNPSENFDQVYYIKFALEAFGYMSSIRENKYPIPSMSVILRTIWQMSPEILINVNPSSLMKKTLSSEKYCYRLEIKLHFFAKMVFQVPETLNIVLKIVHFFLNTWPLKGVRDVVHQYGLLLTLAQLLAEIANRHPDIDIQTKAIFGGESSEMSGLRTIWLSEYMRKNIIFKKRIANIVIPLLFKSNNEVIRKIILQDFFFDAYDSQNDSNNLEYICIGKAMDIAETHLEEMYIQQGLFLKFKRNEHFGADSNVSRTIYDSKLVVIKEAILDNQTVAVKIMKDISLSDMYESIQSPEPVTKRIILDNELIVLRHLQGHCNIIKLFTSTLPILQPLHIITEYMDSNNLWEFLNKRRQSKPLPPNHFLLDCCRQICTAIKFCGEKGIIHRDLCARNILVKIQGLQLECKLSGFGLAKFNPHGTSEFSENEGSKHDSLLVRHIPPESFYKNLFSTKSDIWMFGLVIFEIFTFGSIPFPEIKETHKLHERLSMGHTLVQPVCISSDIFQIILKCLLRDPSKRPTFGKLENKLHLRLQNSMQNGMLTCPSRISKYYNDVYMDMTILPDSAEVNSYERKRLSGSQDSNPNYSLDDDLQYKDMSSAYQFPKSKTLQVLDISDRHIWDCPQNELRKGINGESTSATNVFVERLARQLNISELDELRSLKHKNILKIIGMEMFGSIVQLISEWLWQGNIIQYLLNHAQDLEVTSIIDILVQIAKGMQYLHIKDIVHCDLKAEFVYISEKIPNRTLVKIGRLGRSHRLIKQAVDSDGRVENIECVPMDSIRWSPVEVLFKPAFYSYASDVYSFSLVCWQLLYAMELPENTNYKSVVPFPDWPQSREMFLSNLQLQLHPHQPRFCPDWLYILMKKCWRERIKRPSFDLIIECMTSKIPFDSSVLKNFKEKFKNSIYVNLNLDEEQPEDAPYVINEHQNLSSMQHFIKINPCLNEIYEEGDLFYMKGSRFSDNSYQYSSRSSDGYSTGRSSSLYSEDNILDNHHIYSYAKVQPFPKDILKCENYYENIESNLLENSGTRL